jgi:ribosomal protein S18 acetylase RimI-like enzyme
MTITVRRAVQEDATAIALVQVESWRSTYAGLISASTLASLSTVRLQKFWEELLSDPQSRSFLFVAEAREGQIVGFVSGRPERNGDQDYPGEVGALYLLQAAQRQGTGRRLMRAAAAELIERGYGAMLLWVLHDNLGARAFYESMGGNFLREQTIEIGDQQLHEVAYGWKDLAALAGEKK